ncbi:MAG: hypothetical protein ACK4IY_06400, partial [Chitinophagales bacterium]
MWKNRPVWQLGVAGLVLAIGVMAWLLQDTIFKKEQINSSDSLAMIEQLTPEIALLSQQIKSDPANPGLYFNRANAYFAYGNLKFALQDYEKA